ncbi:cysteine-rich CWC family protein [Variovorax soli]|uniref:cysteine-rich CWC family protein n=1 Tax=Variovorax soli TaxID=376815 RepID=UPI00286CE8B8|nr:cysteine-rich CWC family protein [Variovorax soli]
MGAKPSLDASCCPLCGEANHCAIERERETGQSRAPCWCRQASFSPGVLESVPAGARGLACVCARCATRAGLPAPSASGAQPPEAATALLRD